MSEPEADWVTTTLETGGPWELLPQYRAQWEGAARKYLQRDHPQDAKDRVKDVWLDLKYRPPWQAFRKMPDLRDQIHSMADRQPPRRFPAPAGDPAENAGNPFG